MKKQNDMILIIVAIIAFWLFFINPHQEEIFSDWNTSGNHTQSDLRQISMPYLTASDIKDICLQTGATWHETTDWVGCVGTGSNNCNQAIVLSANQQCLAVGANWTCDMQNVYCKYGG